MILTEYIFSDESFFVHEIDTTANNHKIYYRHSGFPGGIKQISFQDQMEKNPERYIWIEGYWKK